MNSKNSTHGIFAISLDCELYWGMRDHVAINQYTANLESVENVVESLLQLFKTYEIHATWAPVGFLFFPDLETLKQNLPDTKPHYQNTMLDPYMYIENNSIEAYHFIPNIIKKIASVEHQEIGTHTFSHFYCLEDGQNIHQFEADIEAAASITKKELGKDIKSIIFPRNQWNETYLPVLTQYNILSFRGTEKHWIYNASDEAGNNLAKRALRLLDAYINITGYHTYALNSVDTTQPYNLPASRFLRPVSSSRSFFEPLRLNRVLDAMTYAAKSNKVYHLWWHPHNFGADMNANIEFLEKILSHFSQLQKTYRMQSLNMQEIASLIEQQRELKG
jgi:peptidoglycan/xylan/chitin deacetylase (PgdA/CDA1 family)